MSEISTLETKFASSDQKVKTLEETLATTKAELERNTMLMEEYKRNNLEKATTIQNQIKELQNSRIEHQAMRRVVEGIYQKFGNEE